MKLHSVSELKYFGLRLALGLGLVRLALELRLVGHRLDYNTVCYVLSINVRIMLYLSPVLSSNEK